jgi:hypothetical protein
MGNREVLGQALEIAMKTESTKDTYLRILMNAYDPGLSYILASNVPVFGYNRKTFSKKK